MRAFFGIIALGGLASAAQAEVTCDFHMLCRAGLACETVEQVKTVVPAERGSFSRTIQNGTDIWTGPLVMSAPEPVEGLGTIIGRPDGSVTYVMNRHDVVHILTATSHDGGSAVLTVQEVEGASSTSYFGSCAGQF